MVSKRELLSSVLIRRVILNRIVGLGFVLGYKARNGNMPPVDKEGFGTGPRDNGALFVRDGMISADYCSGGINLRDYGEDLTKEKLESIVDEALTREKVTLLGEYNYAACPIISNI